MTPKYKNGSTTNKEQEEIGNSIMALNGVIKDTKLDFWIGDTGAFKHMKNSPEGMSELTHCLL
jgi:hypothetical protein